MKIVKEGTVVKVEKGRPPRVHVLFDGDEEPAVYDSSPNTPAVGARVYFTTQIQERRGRKLRLTEVVVKRAIRKLGEGATQKAVADELKVSARSLHNLQTRIGKTWDELTGNAYNLTDEI
jgi:hypothetical protein